MPESEIKMRLTECIEQNREKILAEWASFARTLLPWANGMGEGDLRDHAGELLSALVVDMQTPETSEQRSEKSQGQAVRGVLTRVGQKHANQRLDSGFNLDQLVSEYRALRASILRLWAEQHGDEQDDVTRFNEAIDESLTEATFRYSTVLEHTREQFLAILGHDLRNPLRAIVVGAAFLTRSTAMDGEEVRVAARMLASANRMNRMVDDLLDFTRARLGTGIPLTLKRMDLKPVCEDVISELEVVHPACRVRFEGRGLLVGEWDGPRLQQLVTNLVANALEHGGSAGNVNVVAQEHGEDVVLRVQNGGPIIPADVIERLFDPRALPSPEERFGSTAGPGLGLYVAREIVNAHGGTIAVTSTEQAGTTFSVQLPRRASVAPPAA